MRSGWRKHRRHESVELNITAFMNLMVILVPFLLITAVFSQVSILELNLPSSNDQPSEMPETLQLEIVVRDNRLEVGERNAGLLTSLPRIDGDYDLEGLSAYLKRVKAKYPDKVDATILLEQDVPYDALVQVMDTVRVYAAVNKAGEDIQAELFPEISIGDAPVVSRS